MKTTNVAIALLKGVAIIYCCRGRKIPDNQIYLLTSIGNNKGVAIITSCGRECPDFNRFLSTCPTSITSCTTHSYPNPLVYYCGPPPSVNQKTQNKFSSGGGGHYCHGNIRLF